MEFITIAEIAYRDKMCAIMQLVELFAETKVDEAMVFQVEMKNPGNKYLLVF